MVSTFATDCQAWEPGQLVGRYGNLPYFLIAGRGSPVS
jgi:hypothetical protein